jgi:hypothetical protein
MKLADIEKIVFASKNEIGFAPEAIDGGYSERPVSHYEIYVDDYSSTNTKYIPRFISVFDCYDGWDSMDYEVGDGKYDTYAEALFACYLEIKCS